MKSYKENGITLIALVVTIVVLLILAGVSISMLTGENGVISQAGKAKEATEQARVEELVDVAVTALIGENLGSAEGITPKMVADEVNKMENRTDVISENETTFPTNIIFQEEKRKVKVNLNADTTNNDKIYSADIDESDIAPTNLFNYEIINSGEIGAIDINTLPTRTVKITGIKPEYCNSYYSSEKYIDTNYEIIYEGNKITDTLVIPYQVDGKFINNGIEGEYYKIEEVDIRVPGGADENSYSFGYTVPKVETIIYPNTVKRISNSSWGSRTKCIKKSNIIKSIRENR